MGFVVVDFRRPIVLLMFGYAMRFLACWILAAFHERLKRLRLASWWAPGFAICVISLVDGRGERIAIEVGFLKQTCKRRSHARWRPRPIFRARGWSSSFKN